MPRKTLGPLSSQLRVDTTKLIAESKRLSGLLKRKVAFLDDLEERVRQEVVAELEVVGQEQADKLKKQADQSFQATPSYIWESIWKLPGRKQYPPGTIGTFSQENSPIAGSYWGDRIQKYITGNHFMRDRLTYKVSSQPGFIGLELGYARLSSRLDRLARYVLFGTTKMQARPIITNAFSKAIKTRVFQKAITRAVRRVGKK